jgi:hypothetical protein
MCECIEISMRWNFFSLFFGIPEDLLLALLHVA